MFQPMATGHDTNMRAQNATYGACGLDARHISNDSAMMPVRHLLHAAHGKRAPTFTLWPDQTQGRGSADASHPRRAFERLLTQRIASDPLRGARTRVSYDGVSGLKRSRWRCGRRRRVILGHVVHAESLQLIGLQHGTSMPASDFGETSTSLYVEIYHIS